jgi:actin-related protein
MQLIVLHPPNDQLEARAVANQAKNNVTSRVRLDEKYVERRAVQKLAKQPSTFARVFGVFLQRDARLESSSVGDTASQETNQATSSHL